MAEKKQVKSRERVVERGEVFTAEREVKAMLDLVNKECERIDSCFLEPACGDGNFLVEILKRKLAIVKSKYKEDPFEYEKNTVLAVCSLYGIDIMLDNVQECQKRLFSVWDKEYTSVCKENNEIKENVRRILKKNIVCGNTISKMCVDEDGNDTTEPIAFLQKALCFDVIVSNPPYQMNDGGAQASAKPLYHKFILLAKELNPKYMLMIVPSRWFVGGKGLDAFRKEMLHDTRIRKLCDFPNAADCFPGVEIKGGVCYFLWDRDYSGDCEVVTYKGKEMVSVMVRPLLEKHCEIFIRDNKAIEILKKVQKHKEESLTDIISARKPFAFPTNFKDFHSRRYKNCLKLYANHTIGYIGRNKVEKHVEWIDQWKVLVPEAIGSGDTKTDRVNPILAAPGEICTETYLVFGPCAGKEEAENLCAYIQTKFFHFMLGLKKITQHTTSKVYEFVPMQDFSVAWTDELLYKKYGLTEEEIAYIETSVWT